MFDCSKDVHDSSSQDEECKSLSGLLFTSQFSCDTDKNIQEKKKIETENYYLRSTKFLERRRLFYLMKYLVLFMLSKKLPLLGPNKEREECIVLPAADTGGGGVTSAVND